LQAFQHSPTAALCPAINVQVRNLQSVAGQRLFVNDVALATPLCLAALSEREYSNEWRQRGLERQDRLRFSPIL